MNPETPNSSTRARRFVHPAAPTLRRAAHAERRALIQALAVEADWRCHDGPEWAARYWAAFGDLRRDAARDGDMRRAAETASRLDWQPLAPVASDQARAVFRALLAALHPQVAPAAAAADSRGLFAHALRAYRAGDAAALRSLLAEAGPFARTARLPADIVALRREHARLFAARSAVDRRLATLSQQFPFNLRHRLADADWVRRQRLALQQAIVFSQPPRRPGRHRPRQQVS